MSFSKMKYSLAISPFGSQVITFHTQTADTPPPNNSQLTGRVLPSRNNGRQDNCALRVLSRLLESVLQVHL